MDTTQEFLSRTADDLERGETIVAVQTTFCDGTVERYCADCEKLRFMPVVVSDRKLLERLEELSGIFPEIARIDVLSENYGDLWTDNGYLFLGKICQECHITLGGWHVCKFCGEVEFHSGDPHVCEDFEAAQDEDHPLHTLWHDFMDGIEDSYQEDGFMEDVL